MGRFAFCCSRMTYLGVHCSVAVAVSSATLMLSSLDQHLVKSILKDTEEAIPVSERNSTPVLSLKRACLIGGHIRPHCAAPGCLKGFEVA